MLESHSKKYNIYCKKVMAAVVQTDNGKTSNRTGKIQRTSSVAKNNFIILYNTVD